MATQKLNLTRDQLSSFLQNFEQVKQFEKLFQVVDSLSPIILVDFEFSGDNAQASANNALAMIAMLAQDTAVSDAAIEAKLQQALDAIPRLAQDTAVIDSVLSAKIQFALDAIAQLPEDPNDCSTELRSQLAELQKQVDGLAMNPRIELGSMAFENTGANGSFTTVDLKTVTVVNGIITNIV